ncbi:MAG: UbiA family prenyltransferase [Nitrospirae bacterium]|nr:MAG: UbiA family prenyltransferase [Nitrospirota bacterium]
MSQNSTTLESTSASLRKEADQACPTTSQESPVLCVDLDGTLIATDLFWESLVLMLKQAPLTVVCLPFWACRGPAYLKQAVARRVTIDVRHLPYRMEVLSWLTHEHAKRRRLLLVTGSDLRLAQAVAAHLGLFTDVMGSQGDTNLIGPAKRDALITRFGSHGFDYVGNSSADLPVWSSANAAILVAPSSMLIRQAQRTARVARVFHSGNPSGLLAWAKAFRLHQWIKNTLVFLPIIAAHPPLEISLVAKALYAFFAFSLCASGLYLVNDLLDLPADRRHPRKQHRPLASGALRIPHALIAIPILVSAGFGLALTNLPAYFTCLLALYALATLGYSLSLKKLAIIDVLTLAGFYTLRVLAGGVALGIHISAWLLAFSLFFFLSLALGKRHSELRFRKVTKFEGIERRAYLGIDKEALGIMGIISGYLSVLVLALYLTSEEVLMRHERPQLLWLLCPLLLYWISRTWLLAHRGTLEDDPLIVALRDPHSYAVAATMGLLGILAL